MRPTGSDVPPAGMVLDMLNEGFPAETRPISRKKRQKEFLPAFERTRERHTGKAVAFIVCRRARFVDYPLQIFRGGIRRAPGADWMTDAALVCRAAKACRKPADRRRTPLFADCHGVRGGCRWTNGTAYDGESPCWVSRCCRNARRRRASFTEGAIAFVTASGCVRKGRGTVYAAGVIARSTPSGRQAAWEKGGRLPALQ